MASTSIMPGPAVGGKSTELHLIERAELPSHPLRRAVEEVIDAAFAEVHPPYLPRDLKRIYEPDALIKELNERGFTYVLAIPDPIDKNDTHKSSARTSLLDEQQANGNGLTDRPASLQDHKEPPTVIASISAHPFEAKQPYPDDAGAFFSRAVYPDPRHWDLWEIKLLTIHPQYWWHGLGSALMGLVEAEIKRRFEASALASTSIDPPERATKAVGSPAESPPDVRDCGKGAGSSLDKGADTPPEKVPAVTHRRNRGVMALLHTITEITHDWYSRRGYVEKDRRYAEKGFLRSETGFNLSFMDKEL